ncbi:hypothetical protein AB0L40_15540 [Patulibacter sp. NPDC049589]|uniref:hypothetical protein n=1 Tax=Patulibacter sp. NPDC049589 TaxID=3154731 RepID=UPI003431338A
MQCRAAARRAPRAAATAALVLVRAARRRHRGSRPRVRRRPGRRTLIPVQGGPLTNGDGLLRSGSTLLAVQNRLDRVAVLKLSRGDRSATVRRTITDPQFDVPTTLAIAKSLLFTVDARFTTSAADTAYDVVRVDGK